MPTALSPAPPWRAWLIWGVAVAAYVLSVTNRTSLAAVGVDAAHRFNADASTLSMFAVLQLAVYGAMQLPIGVLLDRMGTRPVIVAGMTVMAFGQLVMALSPNVGIAIVARMLLGAGDAAVFPSVLRVVATWFPAQRASLMVQLTGLVGMSGQLAAIAPLAALVHATTWTVAFGSLAGLCVLFSILLVVTVRNRPPGVPADVSVNTDTGAIRVVTSTVDTRIGVRATLSHPGTRLAFWSHFTTPFAGTAFIMLWGIPFLTAGEGLSAAQATLVTTVYIVVGMVVGPIMGTLSGRMPNHRSRALVLPSIAFQMVAWLAVIAWPGPAPLWLLFVLAVAMGIGGPASMIAFDHARTHNPTHRLSTATGITNTGGFISSLVAIFLIGAALDLQGAGTPETYSLEAFRVAALTLVPLWVIGSFFIVLERRRTRVLLGMDQPRRRRSPRP